MDWDWRLKNIELNAYDDRHKKSKLGKYGDKVCTNFSGLNGPQYNLECESFIVISVDSLLVQSKYYLQVYLESCSYKIGNKKNDISWWQYF